MEWRKDLNRLRELTSERAAEQSELAKEARDVGKNLAGLPD